MFEWCSIHVTRISSPGFRKVRAQACATRLMLSVVPRVKTTSRDCAGVDQPLHLRARALVGPRRPFAQQVRGAMDVGVVVAVVVLRARRAPAAASATCWRCRDRPAACRGRSRAGSGNPPAPSRRRTSSIQQPSLRCSSLRVRRQPQRHKEHEDTQRLIWHVGMHSDAGVHPEAAKPCSVRLRVSVSLWLTSVIIDSAELKFRPPERPNAWRRPESPPAATAPGARAAARTSRARRCRRRSCG